MNEIKEIEKIINYEFKNKELLETAFIHSSCGKKNNERLEYLGDAILDMIVADMLFSQSEENEGHLTKKRAQLVCEDNLSSIINKLGLNAFIKVGNSFKTSPTNAMCADLFESILAAIYLDNNHSLNEAISFVRRFIEISDMTTVDYKSLLQEYIQRDKNNSLVYETNQISNEDNFPQFECHLIINGKKILLRDFSSFGMMVPKGHFAYFGALRS
jgi:ribonuclease-3